MPIYTFYNKRTKKEFDEMMSISEMEEYTTKNKHITQVIKGINIVSGVSGTSYKTDQGWKDNLSRIAEAHPRSALAQQVGKKSIKQAKTERVLAKHKAKKLGKKFNG
jgi:hypothetical protein